MARNLEITRKFSSVIAAMRISIFLLHASSLHEKEKIETQPMILWPDILV